jgi:ferredoxin-NADP reductase
MKPQSRDPQPDLASAIERALPRAFRRRWSTWRTDLRWLARDLRGERRPVVIERAAGRRAPAGISTRELRVDAIERETDDALTFRLADPSGEPIVFEAGQFLSFHLRVGGQLIKRAYSLSSSPLDGPTATITVKRIPGGRASSWLHDELRSGASLKVLGPSGSFVAPAGPEPAHLVMIGGGSGITPLFSILQTVLRSRPALRVSLLFGNRREQDVIFGSRLRALAERYPERFSLELALEDPPRGFRGTVGRLDSTVLGPWLDGLAPSEVPRTYFLCGPAGMMDVARAALEERGAERSAILEERFQSPGEAAADVALPSTPVTVQLRVRDRDFLVPVEPGQTILEAGLAAGAPMPFSCAMGGCAACKATLVTGEVRMDEPNCLSPSERAQGQVLTCCSRPLGSARIEASS